MKKIISIFISGVLLLFIPLILSLSGYNNVKEPEFKSAEAKNTSNPYDEFVKRIEESKSSKLSISSIPEESKVFIGPKNLSSSVEHPGYGFNTPELLVGEKYLKGKTPISIDVEPGSYQIGVITNDVPEWVQKDIISKPSRGLVMTMIEGFTSRTRADNPNESLIFIVKNKKVIRAGKIYILKIKPNEEKKLEIKDLFKFD